jgi:hypothetical protein
MIEIVCATGGTCGDMIVAILDPKGTTVNNGSVQLSPDRGQLKKPHTFVDDLAKNNYINAMSLVYNSIPSHDLDHHVKHQQSFITVTVEKFDTALWAAERFKKLHRPHVWEEMQKFCGASNIEQYAQTIMDYSNLVSAHTDRRIKLERILEGHAIEDLRKYTTANLDNKLYQDWLQLQNHAR